jgi:hypothetical protein
MRKRDAAIAAVTAAARMTGAFMRAILTRDAQTTTGKQPQIAELTSADALFGCGAAAL